MSARTMVRTLAAALGLAALAPAARADNLDPALLMQSQELLKYIKANAKGKPINVGVLKFRATKDGGGETYNAGPINSKLAERLEMTLIMALAGESRNKPPIQVIHDASGVAAAQKQGLDYTIPEHRAKFLALDYPLAIGSDKVKADLFLTGTVKFDSKTRKTSVMVRGFGKDGKGFTDALPAPIEVATDRSTLADMGMGFALAKRGDFLKLPDAGEQDKLAVDNAVEVTKTPLQAADNPVDLKIFFAGKEVSTEFDMQDSRNKLRLQEKAKPGDKIHFTLANNSPTTRYAAVLKVNGVSTLFDETEEPRNCRKFILNAKAEPIVIDGFYFKEQGPGNIYPFTVTTDVPASEPMKDEEAGVISLSVFAEGDPAAIPSSDGINTRGLSARKWTFEKEKNKSINEMAGMLRGRKPDTRGFLLPDKKNVGNGGNLVVEPFQNANQVYFLQIRYVER